MHRLLASAFELRYKSKYSLPPARTEQPAQLRRFSTRFRPLPSMEEFQGLYRWSLGVQFGTVTLVAIFFAILAGSVRLAEVRMWALAWGLNALALLAGFSTVFALRPPWQVTVFVYLAAKTLYVLCLASGARHHTGEPLGLYAHGRWMLVFALGWATALILLAPNALVAVSCQFALVGLVLVVEAVRLLRSAAGRHSRWLGWAFLATAVVFLHYVPLFAPLLWGGRPVGPHLHVSSFLDAGAELLIALASLVALGSAAAARLERANRQLEKSQAVLRGMVTRDPLTGLLNRRALRATLDETLPHGAAMAFFDVDRFKRVNDLYGHAAGDACLIRLAEVLREQFRPDDAFFRWGGDEFLAIAPGMSLELAHERVDAVRGALRKGHGGAPAFTVSAGVSWLPPGGEPDRALSEADRAMYEEKVR